MAEPRDDESAEPDDRQAEAEESFLRWLGELVVLVGLAVALAVGIKTFVVQPFVIPSGSMLPTLQVGDRVLANKFVYRFEQPKRGDIVVFTSPEEDGLDLIKRVVAVGGQSVDVREGRVWVDEQPLTEPYTQGALSEPGPVPLPVRVPKGYVWVMGDNRTNSRDSRYFGPLPVSSLLGRAFAIYWPVNRIGSL